MRDAVLTTADMDARLAVIYTRATPEDAIVLCVIADEVWTPSAQ